MIAVESISKHYGELRAVDQVSFSVGAGEVLGFLGPNGAGKSTTMKMLAGFLQPTSGTAVINGHDIRRDALAARRQLGYLPEGAPSYEEMNVAEFLRFIARARQLSGPQATAAVDSAADRLELGTVMGQRIETLSKGFKRRVGLAQAILHDPPVLILDEPTDGLDPNQKHQVRRLIRSMAADKTIIVSTHILEEVEAVCTRAIIIAHGRILADDTPAGLTRQSRYQDALNLRVDDPDAAASALSELAEVARVERRDRELIVFPQPGRDVLEPVVRLIGERGWTVHGLRLRSGRLDDVFRDITHGEAA